MSIVKFNNWIKSSIRLVFTVLIRGLLFISSAFPAQAASSNPNDGEVSLNRIQEKTDSVAKANPRSMEELSKEAENGLNAVQGSADKSKMISPKDASDKTTVKEQAKNFLEDLTN